MKYYTPPEKKRGRKKKIRTINSSLGETVFQPLENNYQKDIVVITHDEIETLRLKAIKGFNIIQGAQCMNIGKSTFANTFNQAVKKITEAILNGKIIYIDSVDDHQFEAPLF